MLLAQAFFMVILGLTIVCEATKSEKNQDT